MYLSFIFPFLLGTLFSLILLLIFFRLKSKQLLLEEKSRHEVSYATLCEKLRGNENQLLELRSSLHSHLQEIASLRIEIISLREKNSQLEVHLLDERKAYEEKLQTFQDAKASFSDTFKSLSAQALKNNNESFLELAKIVLERHQESAKGELEKRQTAIDELVKPLQVSLEKVDNKIEEMEKTRTSAFAGVKEHMRQLSETQTMLQRETSNLVKALRSPQVRGRWGEIQLRRVVEISGMLEYCDFLEQPVADTENGRVRPDLIVKLPNNRQIVVDAKVPLYAYIEAIETSDENERHQKLQTHARQIRKLLSELSAKSYWEEFQPAPEFVVLFLPGEPFFTAALEKDPELIEYGVERRDVLATPTTLIALLRAVAFGWKQEQMSTNAKLISELGKNLYERISVLSNHFEELQKNLNRTVSAYNKTVASLEGRIFPVARKFRELGVTSSASIEVIDIIDQTPRHLLTQQSSLEEQDSDLEIE